MTTSGAACARHGDEIRGEPIGCAVAPSGELAQECRFERIDEGRFIVHHPDGAFRRFVLSPDNKQLLPADGAERANSEAIKDEINLSIGQDRYRIPRSLLEPRP
jgi:hypothetical protein